MLAWALSSSPSFRQNAQFSAGQYPHKASFREYGRALWAQGLKPSKASALCVAPALRASGLVVKPLLSDTHSFAWLTVPEGPNTQYLRTLVPKAIKGMVFGTGVLKIGYLDPLGVAVSIHTAFYETDFGAQSPLPRSRLNLRGMHSSLPTSIPGIWLSTEDLFGESAASLAADYVSGNCAFQETGAAG